MNVIDKKLIRSYTVLVLADRYITDEADRTSESQQLVPEKYREEVDIAVAERTIEVLG